MDFLREVEMKLDLPQAEKSQVMRELKSHYEEVKSELMTSGMDSQAADQETSLRLGDPGDVAQRMQAVHCRATWKTAWLTALPFVFVMILSVVRSVIGYRNHLSHLTTNDNYILGISILYGCVMLFGSVRELIRGRRPMWLATWLAAGIHELSLPVYILSEYGHLQLPRGENLVFFSIFDLIVLAALVLWSYRHSIKWSGIIAAWCLLGSIVVFTVYQRIDVSDALHVSTLIQGPLVMALALRIFGRHPYGNIAQASLFLFAFYILVYSSVAHGFWLNLTASTATKFFIVLALIAFARSAMWRKKLEFLALGILSTALVQIAITIIGYAKYYHSWLDGLLVSVQFTVIPKLLLFVWAILVPMIIERWRQVRRPEIAH